MPANPFQSLSDLAIPKGRSPRAPSLLIIDNLEHLQKHDIIYHIHRTLAIKPASRILLISRQPDYEDIADRTIELKPLTRQEAISFLSHSLGGIILDESTLQVLDRLQGNPLAIRLTTDVLRDQLYTPEQLDQLLQPFTRTGLLGPDGRPLRRAGRPYRVIITDVASVSDDFLKALVADPKLLYQVSPRKFEEIVAELLCRLCYDVTVTQASRDGGKDIYAAKKEAIGSFLYLVECKRYSPEHRVGVGLVRQLHGVVQAERATAGILATTSFFTRDAIEFQTQVAFQLSLWDYLGIQEWLKAAQQRSA